MTNDDKAKAPKAMLKGHSIVSEAITEAVNSDDPDAAILIAKSIFLQSITAMFLEATVGRELSVPDAVKEIAGTFGDGISMAIGADVDAKVLEIHPEKFEHMLHDPDVPQELKDVISEVMMANAATDVEN